MYFSSSWELIFYLGFLPNYVGVEIGIELKMHKNNVLKLFFAGLCKIAINILDLQVYITMFLYLNI